MLLYTYNNTYQYVIKDSNYNRQTEKSNEKQKAMKNKRINKYN